VSWRPCYSAPTPPLAHVVKGYLEQLGVPVLLRTDAPSMYPTSALGAGIEVLVPEDWLPVARKMVERRRARRPRRVLSLPLGRRR
jgi:hypothetical protein